MSYNYNISNSPSQFTRCIRIGIKCSKNDNKDDIFCVNIHSYDDNTVDGFIISYPKLFDSNDRYYPPLSLDEALAGGSFPCCTCGDANPFIIDVLTRIDSLVKMCDFNNISEAIIGVLRQDVS